MRVNDGDIVIEDDNIEAESTAAPMTEEVKEKADKVWADAFLTGTQESFDEMSKLVSEGTVHLDYKVRDLCRS